MSFNTSISLKEHIHYYKSRLKCLFIVSTLLERPVSWFMRNFFLYVHLYPKLQSNTANARQEGNLKPFNIPNLQLCNCGIKSSNKHFTNLWPDRNENAWYFRGKRVVQQSLRLATTMNILPWKDLFEFLCHNILKLEVDGTLRILYCVSMNLQKIQKEFSPKYCENLI